MSEQKVRNCPEISVIVPVYRVEKYLNDCIDSILAQTFADFELILVDDGSPDSCPALCDAAAARDSRIRVLHQKNRGLSGARNAGLDIVRGRWLAFVDSDDMLLPQALEKAHSTAEKTGADVVLYGFAFTDENGKNYEVYFVASDDGNETTSIPVPAGIKYEISGNNADGFIVTVYKDEPVTAEPATEAPTEAETETVPEDTAQDVPAEQ